MFRLNSNYVEIKLLEYYQTTNIYEAKRKCCADIDVRPRSLTHLLNHKHFNKDTLDSLIKLLKLDTRLILLGEND
ncbi:MAG: hypothetical protein ACRC6T_05355 [Sarcina sp.]